jgi:hypothetical protein
MDTYTLGLVYTWIPTNGLVIHKVKIFTVCYPMRLPAGFKSVLNYELTLDRCRGVGDCIHTPFSLGLVFLSVPVKLALVRVTTRAMCSATRDSLFRVPQTVPHFSHSR